ncbi:MAG: class I SAM-dependent methyltransferase [Candidatus Omnitrophica bacterium]|nr:class I SAM-dependent methyltransferase [Candidatus Omnitrophota bacterium]
MNRKSFQEFVGCNLCGKDNSKLLFVAKDRTNEKGGFFRIVKCKSCGLVYVNPRPIKQELFRYYLNEYQSRIYDNIKMKKSFIWETPNQSMMELKARSILKYKKSGRILDVGCKDGLFLKFLKDLGWQTYGIELNPKAVQFAKERFGLDISCGDIEEASYPLQFFDVVSLIHSLEHLRDPVATLRKIHLILKEDGIVVIEVPNFGGFSSFIFRDKWLGISAPLHLYHFTRRTLEKILIICKFSPIEFKFISTHTKYMAEYSESLRYLLGDLGLYNCRPILSREDNFNPVDFTLLKPFSFSSGKVFFHYIEYLIFFGLGRFMDIIKLGGNLSVVAKKI